MSVLVAKHEKDKIILGADSCFYYGGLKQDLTDHQVDGTIRQINGITYAYSGSRAESQHFALFCEIRKPESATILGVQRFFIDFGRWKRDNGFAGAVENSYLFIYETRLFEFHNNAVHEILEGDFTTSGTGYKEAYMAIYLGQTVKQAIELTMKFNVWAGGKAQIVEIHKKNTQVQAEEKKTSKSKK